MAKQYKIMLDPGHGGGDPGAIGPTGLKEKDITLKITNQLGKRLSDLGFSVFYTRIIDQRIVEGDVPKDLSARCAKANKEGVDYFISVHCNSLDASSNGTETFVYKKGGEGEKLAIAVQKELIAELKLTDRGVKEGNLAVLRESNMPAILVETAFISNKEEEKLLRDEKVQARIVESIARGLCKHLGITYLAPVVGKSPVITTNPDKDTLPSEWAKVPWSWAIDKKITDGSRPQDTSTREEMVALLHKYNKQVVGNKLTATVEGAVSSLVSDWAKEAWGWAVGLKITDGTRPKETITREEVIALLYKYNKLTNPATKVVAVGAIDSKNQPSDWAKESWSWAISKKITDGSRPKDTITREEVIGLLYNYDKLGSK